MLLIEWLLFAKTASARVVAAIAVVCTGVGLSTLTDLSMGASGRGLSIGAAAVAATALYQVAAAARMLKIARRPGRQSCVVNRCCTANAAAWSR